MRILLVDDDAAIRLAFTAALTRRGHHVTTADSVATALEAAAEAEPDVGVIDVMLPDGTGFTLCRRIRDRWGFPTVLLTARDEDADVVGGLDAGADDYVVKPVSPAVLEARLRAVLRRASAHPPTAREDEPGGDLLRLGDLVIDPHAAEVIVGQNPLPLSATEYRLLLELAGNPGQAFSRGQLIDRVWTDNPPGTSRVVDTTVQRLRAKLADAGAARPELQTLRGIGYRLR